MGNLKTSGSNGFTYNVENRLRSTTGSNAATLSYDTAGRLHKIIGGGDTTRFGAACPEFSSVMLRTSLREAKTLANEMKANNLVSHQKPISVGSNIVCPSHVPDTWRSKHKFDYPKQGHIKGL